MSASLFSRDNTAVGRPSIEVEKDDIQSLRALNFSWTKISRNLTSDTLSTIRGVPDTLQ